MNKYKLLAGIVTGAISTAGTSCFVQAAEADDSIQRDESEVERILVTVRKRPESLQDIPESLTVFTSADIENSRIESLEDFVSLTPNMTIRDTFRSNESFISLRGISSSQGVLPPVSFIVDGVQQGSNDFLNQDLIDIQSIEVLKGPQGTLFGQGAIAGAISIRTKAPTDDQEGFIKATYGNGNSYRLSGAISGPINDDTLSYRLSGYIRDSDGLKENTDGQKTDFSDQQSIRGRLQYIDDNWDVSLRMAYTTGDAGSLDLEVSPTLNKLVIGDIDDVDNRLPSSNILGTESTTFKDTSLSAEYENDSFVFTSVTGYNDVVQETFGDADFSEAPNWAQDIPYGSTVINQEFRLSSIEGDDIEWVAGLFYQESETTKNLRVGPQNISGTAIDYAACLGIIYPGPCLSAPEEKESKSSAVFGQLTLGIIESLSLTLGLRYDHDEQTSMTTTLITREAGVTTESNIQDFASAAFHAWQPKVQLNYKFSDDMMGYITYAEGFRSGGFTESKKFDSEKTENYDIGFKTNLFDSRLTLNSSLFYTTYSNQQLSFVASGGSSINFETINVKETELIGLELEAVAYVTEDFKMTLGYGLTDSEIKAVDTDALVVLGITDSPLGKESALIAPYTVNLSGAYTKTLSADYDLIINASYRKHGAFFFDSSNLQSTAANDFIDLNVKLDSEFFSIGLWAKNIDDTRYTVYLNPTGNGRRQINNPRSYGIEMSYRF